MRNMITGGFLENETGSSLNRSKLDLETLRQNSDYMLVLFMKNTMTKTQNNKYQEIKVKAENLLKLLESD